MTHRKLPIRPGADGQEIFDVLKICGFENLVREIANEHKVPPTKMLGPSKRYSFALARAHLTMVIRNSLAMPYNELADLLGYSAGGAVQNAEKRWGRELEKRYGYVGPWTREYESKCHTRKERDSAGSSVLPSASSTASTARVATS